MSVRVLAFDNVEWESNATPERGGDCQLICGNECFRAGTVVREYLGRHRELLYDIRFDHRPSRISHGHFAEWTRHGQP